MSKWDKLIARIRSLDRGLRFDEIQKVLERYGYRMYRPSGGSSHCTFRNAGHDSITIPAHEPIKLCYIISVRDVIEMEDSYEND